MIRETHVLGGPWKNGLLPLGIAPQVGEYLNFSPQRRAGARLFLSLHAQCIENWGKQLWDGPRNNGLLPLGIATQVGEKRKSTPQRESPRNKYLSVEAVSFPKGWRTLLVIPKWGSGALFVIACPMHRKLGETIMGWPSEQWTSTPRNSHSSR